MPASIEVVAVEAEADDLLAAEVLGEALAERVGVLVDDRDGVAAAFQAEGELAADSAASDDDDVHGPSLRTSGLSRLSVVPRRCESLTAA